MNKISKNLRLFVALLTLAASSFLLPAYANGQSRTDRVESYLRAADLDDDGRIEPNEMSGPIKRYLAGRGYDINERHKIKDIIKASKKKTSIAEPTSGELKVPKFGVEPTKKAGVGGFGSTGETVQYSETVTKKTSDLFEKYDRNQNGFLDADEINRGNWGSPRPSTNDTNGDGRLSFNEILARYQDREVAERRSDQGNNKDRNDNERGRGDRRRGDRGGDQEERGDDFRRGRYGRYRGSDSENDSSADSEGQGRDPGSSRGTTSSSDANKSRLARSKSYVEKYIADRDENKNGVLEGDELNEVRKASKYDTNRDGKIESDEMLAVIAPDLTGSTSSKSSGRRTSLATARSRSSSNGSRASGGFKKVDANADNEVEMHEFAERWTEKKLEEFRKKDKNRDGVISPDEW